MANSLFFLTHFILCDGDNFNLTIVIIRMCRSVLIWALLLLKNKLKPISKSVQVTLQKKGKN